MGSDPKRRAWLGWAIFAVIAISSIYIWEVMAGPDTVVVIYFGKPHETIRYLEASWAQLLAASVATFLTAVGSLLLAGALAIFLLAVGLSSDGRLSLIERFAVFSQTLPILVIVTISLLLERAIFRFFDLQPSPYIYCIVPVTLSLVFTPLVSGIGAIERMPVPLKALLRLWDAPPYWRIRRVYLLYAMAEILTGIRASATWAVGSVLIAEGLTNGVAGDTLTLGNALMRPFSSVRPGQTPTVILVATILGFLVYLLFHWLQSRAERALFGKATAANQGYPLQSSKPIWRGLPGEKR